MQIERILVIADHHAKTDVALSRALALAHRTGASIHWVGFCYDALIDNEEVAFQFNRELARDQLIAETQRKLQQRLEGMDSQEANIQLDVVWAKRIHEWVQERKSAYDLVVKTGHRSEGLLYTPTDWHLLRSSPIPLLLVSAKRWKLRKHHILATIDLGSKKKIQKELNVQVLSAAAQMATILDSELHILYALPISKILKELDVLEPREEERKFRKTHSEEIQALAKEYNIPVGRIHLNAGDPERVITGTARKFKAELVVLGTIARRGVKAALIGNTAEQILHHTNTDILAIKP